MIGFTSERLLKMNPELEYLLKAEISNIDLYIIALMEKRQAALLLLASTITAQPDGGE